ncbi:MAG: glucose-1-phosphate cytidylyltransferase [Anaerolineales bacterium]|nr:glucose-1-phosphate cytidylyltransferase [Anaerolineales bacterium]
MKYYAHYGHTDFVLCLGYRGDIIKNYFLNYSECLSNDFILSDGGRTVHLLNHDISDWTITFVDTGLNANIGQRLMAASPYLRGEEMFMANYADGLTDLNLPDYVQEFQESDKVGSFLAVQPPQSFHVISIAGDGAVTDIRTAQDAEIWINGGYFIFRQSLFDYIRDGEELVEQPFRRLIAANQLMARRHSSFWACMDTFKEKKMFDDMVGRGYMPWAPWDKAPAANLRPLNAINARVMDFSQTRGANA